MQLGVDAWYGTFWYTEVYTPKWPLNLFVGNTQGYIHTPGGFAHKQLGVDAWYGRFWYTEGYTPKWPLNLFADC